MNTFNIVTTIIYIVLSLIALYLYYRRDKASFSRINISSITFSKIYTLSLPLTIVIIGAVLRFYKLTNIPSVDEKMRTSIGYSAFVLSSLIGCLTLLAFFFVVRNLCTLSLSSSEKISKVQYVNGEYLWMPLISLTALSFCPWHILLSKWSLDAIFPPFFVSAGLLFFSLGAKKQHESTSFANIGTLFGRADKNKKRSLYSSNGLSNLFFILSAISYALCMYFYKPAIFIIPVHLIIMCIFFIKKGNMTIFQLSIGIIMFLICLLPLIAVYAISLFKLPAIVTPLFSITKTTLPLFPYSTENDFFSGITHNIISTVESLSVGNSSEQMLNSIPGFAPLYSFTFPVTFLGLMVSFARSKNREDVDFSFISIFLPAFLFSVFFYKDINSIAILFVSVIYFMARGFIFLVGELVSVEKVSTKKPEVICMVILKSVAPTLFIIATMLFVKNFYTFL